MESRVDDSNGRGLQSLLNEPRTNGHDRNKKKRKRDTESHTERERCSSVRVKMEPGLQDYDDDLQTSPVPGSSDQAEGRAQESGSLPAVNVKTERVEEIQSESPNLVSFDDGEMIDYDVNPAPQQEPGPSPNLCVKSEPTEKEGDDIDGSNDGAIGLKSTRHHDGERVGRYYSSQTVYSKYDFKSRKVDSSQLAVYDKKTRILNSLGRARVVIIEGFPGCGKSTQVPQFILDQCCEQEKVCNIVVTQPRKIGAISLAKRVCFERDWIMGSVIGYQVGMDSKTGKDTALTYMTTGVLLQKLVSLKSMKDFTHIIIDEVHERDLECDFLLLIIKKILEGDTEGKEQHVKLILMSATIDTKKFEDYFVFEKNREKIRPHVVKIPFVAQHKVEEFYLDDILQTKRDQLNVLKNNLDMEKPFIQDLMFEACVSCIRNLDELERSKHTDPRIRKSKDLLKRRGAVLVFLPGREEIRRLQWALEKAKQGIEDPKWVVLPLHSSLTEEEQLQVFERLADFYRKIILSTNIAESSVTVPDIEYVIDFCLTKSSSLDNATNFSTLRLAWAAKSQCIQRKGRIGRVGDGKVYRLVSRKFYDRLDNYIQPEMQRSSLESVILMCKKLEMGHPKNLLRDALDRPKISGIERAVSTLKELGALTIQMKDKRPGQFRYDEGDGDLTFVGKVMAALPNIPSQCTRLILLGHSFGVMQETIIIAAALSVRNPFQTGFRKQLDTYLEKLKHAKKSFSDLFALVNVYKFWIKNFSESGDRSGQRSTVREYQWARGAMVHLSVLREIKHTVEWLEDKLKHLEITGTYSVAGAQDPDSLELSPEQGLFLKLAIAGAFYPHYFLRQRPDLKQYGREISKELNGNDCFRTVYFKGFPLGYNGKLYAKHVADYLTYGRSTPTVKFDGQNVLAIFDNTTGDKIGSFSEAIFRAIKLRQLRTNNLEFKILGRENERAELVRWEAKVRNRSSIPCPPLRELPRVYTTCVKVMVQRIESPSQFWVIIEQDFERLRLLTGLIQDNLEPITLPLNKLCPNSLCLAQWTDRSYHRAKVLRTDPSGYGQCLVCFIDYGDCSWVRNSVLYDFSPVHLRHRDVIEQPCMAMECRLKELKPNIILGSHWSHESVEAMKKFCNEATYLEFQIYSIHNSIMSGELVGYFPGTTERRSLNDILLSRSDSGKLDGVKAPESYLSMENHIKREQTRAGLLAHDQVAASSQDQIGDPMNLDFMDPPTNGKIHVVLEGPRTPLEIRNLQACVKCSQTKEVRVENSSVNSVLLDHEPTTSNSRMLVAAHVSITSKNQACMIRDSTVMPSIPGILSIVTMMFAPKVEFRTYSKKYSGMVAGCGTAKDSQGIPTTVHPDNDMEIAFEVEIDNEDVDRINIIRYHLNSLLRKSPVDKSKYHHKRLHDEVIKLLQRDRKRCGEEILPQEVHVWNRMDPKMLHTTMTEDMTFEHDDIFQPHRKVYLDKIVEEEEVRWDAGY